MAINIAGAVQRTLAAAGVPVIGVSIGTPLDKTTWRVDFAAGATAGQRATAATVVAAFALTDPAVLAREQAEDARQLEDRKLQAVAVAVHKRFKQFVPADTMTAQQWRQSLRDEFDALS